MLDIASSRCAECPAGGIKRLKDKTTSADGNPKQNRHLAGFVITGLNKLGAHYTPRAYVERLVLPTVIEPLRAEWKEVQVAALTYEGQGKHKEAVAEISVDDSSYLYVALTRGARQVVVCSPTPILTPVRNG